MAALDDFKQTVADAQAAAYYGKWASQNGGAAAKWCAFRDAIVAGQRPSPPDMAGNRYGMQLVDAGVTYLHQTAPAPPPPSPDPTPTPAPAPEHAPPVPVGALLFEDTFDGAALDLSKWDVKDGRKSGGSPTLWQKGNVTVHDGLLDIRAWRDANGIWYSGEINGLISYKGPRYVETLCQVPAGYGCWAAPLWEVDAPWGAAGVELDVSEQLGKEPNGYHHTIHDWYSPSGHLQSGGLIDVGAPVAAAFHYWGEAIYADGHADNYFDNVLKGTKRASDLGGIWKYATTAMVPMVDLDMGGWGGTPTIAGPVHQFSKHVRVWALA